VKSGNSIDAFTTEGVNRFFVTLLARLIVIVPLYIAWSRLHPREEVVNPGVLTVKQRRQWLRYRKPLGSRYAPVLDPVPFTASLGFDLQHHNQTIFSILAFLKLYFKK
jgi:hypothetical protein